MGLETQFDNINDLNPNWPTDDDPVSEGAAQLRGIKDALQGNIFGDGTSTKLYPGSVNKVNGAVLQTQQNGVGLVDAANTGITTLDLFSKLLVRVAQLTRNPGFVRLVASVAGETVGLQAQAAGGPRDVIVGDPTSGLAAVYFDGVAKLATAALGIEIGAGTTPQVAFSSGGIGGPNVGAVFADGAGRLVLRGSNAGGSVQLDYSVAARLRTYAQGISVVGDAATNSAIELRDAIGALMGGFGVYGGTAYLDVANGQQMVVRNGANNYIQMTPAGLTFFIGGAAQMMCTFGELDVNGARIANVATGVLANDAVNLAQLGTAPNSPAIVFTTSAAGTVAPTQFAKPGIGVSCVKSVTGTYDYTLTGGAQAYSVVATPNAGASGIPLIAYLIARSGNTFSVQIIQTGNGAGVLKDAEHTVSVWSL